jgi:hypothetical protein
VYDAKMEIITPAEIEQAQKKFETFTEADIRKLMKTYQRKQTALLVYSAAVAQREELNDDEYDVLVSSTLLIWVCMKKKFPAIKKVPIERLDELDNRMFQELESMLEESDEEQEEFIQKVIERHQQPNLLGAICSMTMEAEANVREELKGILFFTAKNVLDALIDVC